MYKVYKLNNFKWDFLSKIAVSPLVGLWVEITPDEERLFRLRSAPLWGCELKYVLCLNTRRFGLRSAPLWGCELKYCLLGDLIVSLLSAPLWGCELKYRYYQGTSEQISQPPCGAVSWNKQINCRRRIWTAVSPLVGLWVEIFKIKK